MDNSKLSHIKSYCLFFMVPTTYFFSEKSVGLKNLAHKSTGQNTRVCPMENDATLTPEVNFSTTKSAHREGRRKSLEPDIGFFCGAPGLPPSNLEESISWVSGSPFGI